ERFSETPARRARAVDQPPGRRRVAGQTHRDPRPFRAEPASPSWSKAHLSQRGRRENAGNLRYHAQLEYDPRDLRYSDARVTDVSTAPLVPRLRLGTHFLGGSASRV